MAVKKNRHSPLLAIGLLAVMAFAILLGVTQINQTQVIQNRAQETAQQPAGASDCTGTVNSPYWNPDNNRVEAKITSTCTVTEQTITNWGQIAIDSGTYRLLYTGRCLTCKTTTTYATIGKMTGTHIYCSYAQVLWTTLNNYGYDGPRLAGGCKTLTF